MSRIAVISIRKIKNYPESKKYWGNSGSFFLKNPTVGKGYFLMHFILKWPEAPFL